MADIQTSITMVDKASPIISKMNKVLNTAVDNCNKLNIASSDMMDTTSIKASNNALAKTIQNYDKIGKNIKAADIQQQNLSESMQVSSNLADTLSTKIKGFVAAFAGIAVVKKSIDLIKNSLDAAQIQANAELQLQVVLSNVGASANAFDEIKNKAAQIQGKGIFGDEAMIAGAAEFATYMNDKDAIQVMMDTLANYAIGMSNGNEVDAHAMVDYATNLGKVMTGSYDAMSKKGFKFTESQKAVIAGTATQAQYTEVLGKNYENMTEDMRKSIAINKAIEESWGNLYEAMSNTPKGQITRFKNAWGDMLEVVGTNLAPSITDFFRTLRSNLPQIQTIILGISNALKVVIDVLNDIINVAGVVIQYLQDNWDEVGIAVTWATATLSAFALGLNSVWIIAIAVIAAFNGIIKIIQDTTGKSISALGIIAASVAMLGTVIWDAIAYAWNFIAIFIEWLVNAFKHPIIATQIRFANLAAFILDAFSDITEGCDKTATNIANAMISAVNFIIKAWNKLTDIFNPITSKIGLNLQKGTEISKISSITSSVRNTSQSLRNYANSIKPDDYWSAATLGGISLDSAYNSGYNWGANLGKKVLDTTKNIGNSLAANGLGDLINDIANNTADTASNTNLTNEDLEYLRNLAEHDTINRFTTSEIKVEMINNNSIASDLDIDGVVNVLTDKLNEQLAMQVEGVYY